VAAGTPQLLGTDGSLALGRTAAIPKKSKVPVALGVLALGAIVAILAMLMRPHPPTDTQPSAEPFSPSPSVNALPSAVPALPREKPANVADGGLAHRLAVGSRAASAASSATSAASTATGTSSAGHHSSSGAHPVHVKPPGETEPPPLLPR
jgi:hypothetical protein